jgi:hypothetical protein
MAGILIADVPGDVVESSIAREVGPAAWPMARGQVACLHYF